MSAFRCGKCGLHKIDCECPDGISNSKSAFSDGLSGGAPTKDVAIFLYDLNGVTAEPWLKAGYVCYIVDIQHRRGTHQDTKNPNLYRVGADIRGGWLPPRELVERCAFVAAFPPCDNLAVSGAAHFKGKGLRALALAVDLFATAAELIDFIGAPGMIENPISTISTYWRKPDYIFNPSDYGGYLPEDDKHPRWPDYIAPRDAYPKKTCIWGENGFVMPLKIEVQPELGYSRQHKKLGGRSLKTKNIRSETPRGFSAAMFLANGKQLDGAA
jgi:hypothetical protein